MTTQCDPIDESTLVQRARGGDAEAFDALHLRHADRAWRLACAVDRPSASAAVAEGFGTAFTAIAAGRRRSDEPFEPVLLAAVRNASLDARRNAATATVVDADADAATPFEAAFRQLPERWRSILWLTHVEGFAVESAAPVVGLAPEAAAQLAERARAGLCERYLHEDLAATGDRNCARAVNRLASYAGNRLDTADAEGLERHLDLCASCNERFRQITSLDAGLAGLSVPAPLLLDDTRAAWTAAISTDRRRSATGLPPRTEKVLAGLSAIVAAAGVIGAALFDRDDATSFDEAAIEPLATDLDEPPLDISSALDLPPFMREFRALPYTRAASTPAAATVVGTSDGAPAIAGDLAPADDAPASPAPAPAAPPPAPVPATGPGTSGAAEDDAGLSVGTTIADIPIAVEIAPEPGLTVGPVSVGSEPQPEQSSQTAPADSPLAPIVEPVSQVADAAGLGL